MKATEDKSQIRITRQRKVILEGIKNTTSHPTAGEVYDMVRRELPRVSLGTVYRNLETLSRDGQIIKLDLDEGQKRFDGRTHHHYHLRCLDCGKVVDINLLPQTEIVKKANRMNNCLVTGYKLEFTGLCSLCRKDRGTKGRGINEETRPEKIFGHLGLKKEEGKMDKYTCMICGYVYDPAVGDSDGGIDAGTSFDDLPDDWVCPVCGVGKDQFEQEE